MAFSRWLAVVLLVPSVACACSVCGCGDPLVAAGDAMPLDGNLRLAAEAEHLTASAASEGAAAMESVAQSTLRPVAVYNPTARLSLVLQVPLVHKDWALGGASPEAAVQNGLGDVDLGGRGFLWEQTDFRHRRRQNVALSLGSSFPTGPDDARVNGMRIDEHAQLGTGAFGPYVGGLYAFHQDPWNLVVDVSGRMHTRNAFGYQYGPAALWSVRGTIRPWDPVAFVVGLDGRLAGRDSSGGELQQDTGGLLLAAVPGIAVNLTGELWLHVAAQLPVFSRLYGVQSVGPVVLAALQYSFGPLQKL